MIIDRISSVTTLILFVIIFTFTTIYQHNSVIKLTYEQQRLSRWRKKIQRERDELLMQFYSLQAPEKLLTYATDTLGMKPIPLSHVITLTTQTSVEFISAPTTQMGRCSDASQRS